MLNLWRANDIECCRLPWAQEVGGSNPLAPISQVNYEGGSEGPALFLVHTSAVWSQLCRLYNFQLTVAGTGFLAQ